jgi:hypothetical protein
LQCRRQVGNRRPRRDVGMAHSGLARLTLDLCSDLLCSLHVLLLLLHAGEMLLLLLVGQGRLLLLLDRHIAVGLEVSVQGRAELTLLLLLLLLLMLRGKSQRLPRVEVAQLLQMARVETHVRLGREHILRIPLCGRISPLNGPHCVAILALLLLLIIVGIIARHGFL